jgi:prepilin-type N-terminal cleavage/methylation domain-containing protein
MRNHGRIASEALAHQRRAFTIPELLVAMALILFIMAILSEAFVAGLDSFSKLKAVGDMQEKLRATTTVLRSDLTGPHIVTANGAVLLSNPWPGGVAPVPTQGFFRISQGSGPANPAGPYYFDEGSDGGVNSYRAVDHILHFSVIKSGGRRQDYFSAAVPGGSPLTTLGPPDYQQPGQAGTQSGLTNSQWAEVAYFLRATGNSTGTTATTASQPLYALYRRQCVVLTDLDAATATAANLPAAQWGSYNQVCCVPNATGTLQFYGPTDLINPARRCLWASLTAPTPGAQPMAVPPWQPWPPPQQTTYYPIYGERGETLQQFGDDLLLTDVISFTVRILRPLPQAGPTPGAAFEEVPANAAVGPPPNNLVFDTAPSIPFPLMAVEIRIRVWDLKTLQTRQITLVQNL